MKKTISIAGALHALKKPLLIMKLTILLVVFTAFQAVAGIKAQTVTLKIADAEIARVLTAIQNQSDFRFLYNSRLKDLKQKVSVDFENLEIKEVLQRLFSSTSLTYLQLENNLIAIRSSNPDEREIRVTGKVTNEAGEGISAASITIKGTSNGTVTDVNGNFAITVDDNATLVISAIGYSTIEIAVGGKQQLNIKMTQATTKMEEVVVIGYGTSRKRDVTGSSVSIKGSEISNLPALSATQAIQGKAAGVQIINSGAPGSAPSVRIRGTGSILGGVDPLYVVDGIITQDIRNINSADILSIDVLKDASSTAIYGARAANGVILITTKAGTKTKFTVNYNAFSGVRLLTRKVEMAGPNLFAVYSNEAANAPAILSTDITGSTDWYDAITRPAIFQNHSLSASGGKIKYRFFVSGGYLNEDGILLDNNYQRYTLRLNHDFNVTKKLKIGNTLGLSHYKSENKPFSLFSQAYNAAPLFNQLNADGSYSNTDKSDVGNPYATLKTTNSRSYGIRGTGVLWGEYQIIKGLSFRSSFGVDAEQNNGWNYTPAYFTYLPNGATAGQKNEKSDLNFSRDSIYHWTWDNFFTYDLKPGADHSLKITIGHTAERRNGWSNNASIADGNVPNNKNEWVLNFKDTTGGQQNIRTPIGNYFRRESYFIRANYVLKERYILNATYRRDGSSNFSPNHKWGNFPAVGLGWIISKEDFMSNQKVFDNLKLRTSFGLVGNDVVSAGAFELIPTERLYSYFGSNRIDGANVTGIKDPNLKWEVAKEFDLGIEFTSYDRKLSGEIDYYHKLATDALYIIGIPALGFGNQFVTNAADISNQGVELSLGYNDKFGKDFTYSVRGNVTYNKNRVQNLGIGQALFDGGLGNGNTSTITTVGQEIGSFWVYKTNGIFQNDNEINSYPHLINTQPGDFRIVDSNNDGVIDQKDKYYAGSYQPKVFFGLNGRLNWKQFDFGLDIFGNMGNKVYNAKKGLRFGGNYNVEYDVATNRWTPGSGINNSPRAYNGTATVSDYYVESGSFIRVNNIALGYTFKSKKEKPVFKNLRVYANAQNPFLFTKYTGFTPELPGPATAAGIELNIYPVSASYMLGINLQL
jgi:TonB-linked SusC/RagA family outer membrane protein